MDWNVQTETFSDDNSVSVYLGNAWLSHGDSMAEALEEARMILNAYVNGARWARDEYSKLAFLLED